MSPFYVCVENCSYSYKIYDKYWNRYNLPFMSALVYELKVCFRSKENWCNLLRTRVRRELFLLGISWALMQGIKVRVGQSNFCC